MNFPSPQRGRLGGYRRFSGEAHGLDQIEVPGRVTALQRGLCAGVTTEGTVFVSHLRLPHASPTTYDDVLVDSFGVLGVAPGPEPWLTGRGADGRLQLWTARDDDTTVESSSLDGIDAMWAAPATDAGTELLLSCHLSEGSWRLRTYDRQSAIGGAAPRRRATCRSPARPTPAFVLGCPRRTRWSWPDGSARPSGAPRRRGRSSGDWRRIHLSPAPPRSPRSPPRGAAGTPGSAAWRTAARPCTRCFRCPFRGLLRSCHRADAASRARPRSPTGGGRPAGARRRRHRRPARCSSPRPTRGNRLCWHDGSRVEGAPRAGRSAAGRPAPRGGAVHLLVGRRVWSVEDPTAG